MKEVWIVKASSGQYDDWWQYDVVAFSTEQAAQDYVAAIPKVDYEALRELQELKNEYSSILHEQEVTENYTDTQWDEYYEKEEILYNKAIIEVQDRYPSADLSVDESFNGYQVQGPVKFGG